MKAGTLNRRVAVQSYTPSRAANGEETKSWSTVATVWASIDPLSGRELLAARDVLAEVSTRIRMRYLSGVTPKMRITHGSSVYRIESVIESQLEGRELELLCVSEAVAT